MRKVHGMSYLGVATTLTMVAAAVHQSTWDLVVHGATPGGIAAAITAAETLALGQKGMSPRVLLTVPIGTELGGMMAGGLGWDDILGVAEENISPVYGNNSM